MFVDALSRKQFANVISCLKNSLMDEIKMHYANGEFFKLPFESLSKLARNSDEIDKSKFFELKDEVICYNGTICIPNFRDYRLNIMNNLHGIPIACHPRFQKTYMIVKHIIGKKIILMNILRDV